MRRTVVIRAFTVVAAAGALIASGVLPASAHESDRELQQTVQVVGSGSSVSVSSASVYSGSVRFVVSTRNPQGPQGGGSNVSLFRLKAGKKLSQLFTALQDEFSQTPSVAARGTREIVAIAVVRGLADVVPGHPETVTEFLAAGQYWAMDLANPPTSGPPRLTPLLVRSGGRHIEQDSDLASQVHVTTADDRFIAPRVWPHRGTYTFTNHADTIHFMALQPVARGTTDAQIQKVFSTPPPAGASGPPPGFLSGPTGGNDVVSPGYSLQLTYNLPPGTYVLLCFVADDRTGMPHALMGMHKVIVLK